MRRDRSGAIAAAILSLCGANAARADLDYEIEAGAGHSDNILRVPADQAEDESLASLGVSLTWEEQTRRIDGDAQVDLSFVEYLSGDIDSEVMGTVDASVIFSIVPERFLWSFTDNFGQARNDPFQPVSPENRENINSFATGPDVRFRFGSALQLRMQGNYTLVDYETSNLDAERAGGGVALERLISEDNTLGLEIYADHSDIEDPDAMDFSRQSASLRYVLTSGRTSLDLQAGYMKLIFNEAPNSDGPLFDLTLTRELSPSTTLTLTASDTFTDAGELLGSSAGEPGSVPGSIIAQSDPFENRSAGLDWRFSRQRTGFSLGAQWNESLYEHNTDLNATRMVYTGSFTRQVRPHLSFELTGQIFDEDYESSGFDAQEWSAGAALSWRFGPHMGTRLRYDYFDRTSSNGVGEYREGRVFLSFTYANGP